MHLNPVYPGMITVLILLVLFILFVIRIRHRVLAGRELLYLTGQDSFEYILIDVRKTRDFERGHIPNAINVPFPGCMEYLPTENMFEKIYIYGTSRHQARLVALKLGNTGYFNVSYFGAFRQWKGPVIKEVQ